MSLDLQDLIGSTVISLEKVQDYHYLVLDRADISLYNPLVSDANVAVGAKLLGIEVRDDYWLALTFDSHQSLVMSLRPEDYGCPESAVFYYRGEVGSRKVVVIQ